jgi:hypothetical protein
MQIEITSFTYLTPSKWLLYHKYLTNYIQGQFIKYDVSKRNISFRDKAKWHLEVILKCGIKIMQTLIFMELCFVILGFF